MMTSNVAVRRAIRCALLANAAAGSAVLPLVATAQQAPGAQAEAATPVQEVVVTGSRIVQPGLQAISPVTTITNAEFKNQGVTRVEDLLNNMPQVVSDQAGNISNGSSGTATVDLRGLGPNRTLVLVNGRRLMPGAPSNTGTTNGVADLNQIPAALVDRVDVLTGGASAVYGADAVAGVVNFVMNDHFQGFRIDANAAEYNHNQHNNVGFAAPARGFGSAPSTVNDGKTKDITFILGGNFADGKGNVTAYLGYRRLDPLLQSQRDFSRCTLAQSAAGVVSCGGSSTAATGRFFASNGTFFSPSRTVGPNQTFIPWVAADAYNFGAVNYYQRPDERFTGGAFAHYNISENHQVYAEFMSMEDRTIAQIAQSGAFLGSGTGVNPATGIPDGDWAITCDNNPLLSASQKALLCPGSVNGISQVLFGRRNVEGGFRQDDLSHLSFRAVIGFKGEFTDAISYDAFFQEGRTTLSENYKNDVSKQRLTNALQVVTDPATGQPICAANANGNNGAPGCVPYNIWTLGGVTPDQTAYFSIPGFIEGVNEERILNGNVTIDMTKWGAQLPSANTGLVVNVGAEYRAEYSELRPDIEFQTNDLAGQGNATPPLSAGLAVHEGFFEARLPLVQDHALVKELSFETGYRYSTYSLGFNTNTYKFGLDWAPTSDVRFRSSFNHAIRAPNLAELYAVDRVALDFNSDPCATSSGSPPTATAAQCALTGLSAAQYARGIPGNPASQYNGLVGGNPNLKPEVSDTKTFGVVLTPSFLPTFNLTLDYFDIRIKNVISSYTSQFIINTCVATGNPQFCGLIHRDATGSLWLSTSGYITDATLNLGALQTRGVDVGSNYRLEAGRAGRLNFELVGTYTTNFNTEPYPGSGEYNCAGYYGNTCLNPDPKWRHRLRATWGTPVQGLDVSAQWRYFGSVTDDVLSPNPLLHGGAPKPLDAHLSSRSYLDLNVAYEVVKGVTARLGVNNLLDKDPPIISSSTAGGFSNGNTYPNVYDALGRYVFLNVTADF